jgi:uncharacterized protein (TIGR03086 family)
MTTSTEHTTVPDLRPALLRAFAVADTLVAEVAPADLDRPTPCSEFDVRGLLDHLVMVARRVRHVLVGGLFSDIPQVTGLADDELAAAWAASLAALRESLPDVEVTSMVTAPFGTVPAAAAVGTYTAEVAVHSWDLAQALGRTDLLDPALAEPLAASVRERLPREGRGQLPFGEVVDVADDAPAYDRLVAWMGRDPHWAA